MTAENVLILTVIISAVVSGCAAPEATAPLSLTEGVRTEVERGVRERLKDPASAQFGQMIASRSQASGMINVCGTVNARNSFGGYSGPTRFIARVSDGSGAAHALPLIQDAAVGSPTDAFAVNALCARVGL